jgi:hypothetical protein
MDLRGNKLINTLSRQDFNLIADSGTVASLLGARSFATRGRRLRRFTSLLTAFS